MIEPRVGCCFRRVALVVVEVGRVPIDPTPDSRTEPNALRLESLQPLRAREARSILALITHLSFAAALV
jgi:hypothetical protein